jgi:hypothetical protein
MFCKVFAGYLQAYLQGALPLHPSRDARAPAPRTFGYGQGVQFEKGHPPIRFALCVYRMGGCSIDFFVVALARLVVVVAVALHKIAQNLVRG